MQRLEVSGAVRPIYGSLGVKRLSITACSLTDNYQSFEKTVLFMFRVEDKGTIKAVPVQALTGLEGFRSFRLPDLKIIGT